MLTLSELKEQVIARYDPDLVVEILEITTEELLDAFEEKFKEKLYKFQEEVDE
jgi:hypothetical protein